MQVYKFRKFLDVTRVAHVGQAVRVVLHLQNGIYSEGASPARSRGHHKRRTQRVDTRPRGPVCTYVAPTVPP